MGSPAASRAYAWETKRDRDSMPREESAIAMISARGKYSAGVRSKPATCSTLASEARAALRARLIPASGDS
jgi:hypothetical protein